MKSFTALLIALALVSVTGIAGATTNTQTESGTILLGHPATGVTGGVSEIAGPGETDGVDGYWIALAQTATGTESVLVTFSSDVPAADLDVYFYDGDFNYLDSDCASSDPAAEACAAPAGAVWAIVDGFTGADVAFTFEYTYETA